MKSPLMLSVLLLACLLHLSSQKPMEEDNIDTQSPHQLGKEGQNPIGHSAEEESEESESSNDDGDSNDISKRYNSNSRNGHRGSNSHSHRGRHGRTYRPYTTTENDWDLDSLFKFGSGSGGSSGDGNPWGSQSKEFYKKMEKYCQHINDHVNRHGHGHGHKRPTTTRQPHNWWRHTRYTRRSWTTSGPTTTTSTQQPTTTDDYDGDSRY